MFTYIDRVCLQLQFRGHVQHQLCFLWHAWAEKQHMCSISYKRKVPLRMRLLCIWKPRAEIGVVQCWC
jgi:hypothetical protein